MGAAFCGNALELLRKLPDNSVNLVVTSPPFALQRKKEYGNKSQSEYVLWLADFARLVYQKLKADGSFVLDLGGAYEKGKPVRSLYNFRIPIYFCDEIGFFLAEDFYWFNPSKLPSPIEWVNKRKIRFLAEDFYWFNPSKLPSPIEWVNKRKIRAKDSINTVWWFSKSEFPKSDVTKVLTEYSQRMKKLLEDPGKFYDPKKRPSGHDIGKGFGKNNGGAIPSNLLQIPNSDSNSLYLRGCKALDVKAHPARFPGKLPEFFIRFLTEPGDLVVDIFAGSNTTGFIAEQENRFWIAFEKDLNYLAASSFRFMQADIDEDTLKCWYQEIVSGNAIEVSPKSKQLRLFERKTNYCA
jgi:site-specific DNA-methyltransferase (cytosine-N4-specific)